MHRKTSAILSAPIQLHDANAVHLVSANLNREASHGRFIAGFLNGNIEKVILAAGFEGFTVQKTINEVTLCGIYAVTRKATPFVRVADFSFHTAERLQCQPSVQRKPQATGASLDQKLAESVARLIWWTGRLVVAVGIPLAERTARKLEYQQATVLALDNGIESAQPCSHACNVSGTVAKGVNEMHVCFIDKQTRVFAEVRLARDVGVRPPTVTLNSAKTTGRLCLRRAAA